MKKKDRDSAEEDKHGSGGGRWGDPCDGSSSHQDLAEDTRDPYRKHHYRSRKKHGIDANGKDSMPKLHKSPTDRRHIRKKHGSYKDESPRERTHLRKRNDIDANGKEPIPKLHNSPAERTHIRKFRPHRTADTHSQRERFVFGRKLYPRPVPGSCFNCGKFGHMIWHCRLPMTEMGMFYRDGVRGAGFDGRRHQYRSLRGNGFHRQGGRFRVEEGLRRDHYNEMEEGYRRRTHRRHHSDKKLHKQVHIRSQTRSRRRHRSHSDSHHKERSKNHRKKSRKRSSKAARKRHRSSSSSPPPPSSSSSSSSKSTSSSSSLSRSSSHSRSSCRSRSPYSQSAPSHSGSSKSPSQCLSSRSHSLSRRSTSMSSKSCSTPSISHSVSCARMSRSNSHSVSLRSQTSSVSRAKNLEPDSHGLHFQSLDNDLQRSHGSVMELPKSSKSHDLQTSDIVGGDPLHVASLTDAEKVAKKKELKGAVSPLFQSSCQWEEMDTIEMPILEGRTGKGERKPSPTLNNMEKLSWKQDEKESLQKPSFGSGDNNQWCIDNTEQLAEGENVLRAGTDKLSDGAGICSNHSNSYLEEAVRKQDNLIAHCCNIKQQADSNIEFARFIETTASFVEHETMPVSLGTSASSEDPKQESFCAARLWPWQNILCRRLKRGPISVSNYERRKLQNEEFHIVDKFIRSSSGWWEKSE